ncbi:hypothetical protein ACQEXU_13200 [Vibrio sp. TRT 21S02]|uniref:hypothetical protein n=1 Tax=Vibrio sp. TRT 21S02 TaxID=3418507 RepID=UPI003CF47026
MHFGYLPPRQAIAENLLINPRGKINQASEPDGTIAAGDYFCDGWKAGTSGCEVYIDADGFRLVSGSIIQLIPNNLEAARLIRTNMDIVTGSPAIKVNGRANKALAGAGEYITIEISGDNSKFTRVVAADSKVKPVYCQAANELEQCQRFYFATKRNHWLHPINTSESHRRGQIELPVEMASTPAVYNIQDTYASDLKAQWISTQGVTMMATSTGFSMVQPGLTFDARP